MLICYIKNLIKINKKGVVLSASGKQQNSLCFDDEKIHRELIRLSNKTFLLASF